MDIALLKPREVDLLFRYPAGRTLRLAKAGKIAFVLLPDGEIRITESLVQNLCEVQKTARNGSDNGD